MEFRAKTKLDDKTEMLIQNVIGAAIDVHQSLGQATSKKYTKKQCRLN